MRNCDKIKVILNFDLSVICISEKQTFCIKTAKTTTDSPALYLRPSISFM